MAIRCNEMSLPAAAVWLCGSMGASVNNPTDPFAFLEPRDQEISEIYEVKKCRATDFEALMLQKGRWGLS